MKNYLNTLAPQLVMTLVIILAFLGLILFA
jgi:hypothetical protein